MTAPLPPIPPSSAPGQPPVQRPELQTGSAERVAAVASPALAAARSSFNASQGGSLIDIEYLKEIKRFCAAAGLDIDPTEPGRIFAEIRRTPSRDPADNTTTRLVGGLQALLGRASTSSSLERLTALRSKVEIDPLYNHLRVPYLTTLDRLIESARQPGRAAAAPDDDNRPARSSSIAATRARSMLYLTPKTAFEELDAFATHARFRFDDELFEKLDNYQEKHELIAFVQKFLRAFFAKMNLDANHLVNVLNDRENSRFWPNWKYYIRESFMTIEE